MINFDLHRRKAFWVDESLAFMLARTDIDAECRDLRVPFPSFALIYTDRRVLSLAERLLSRRPDEPYSGHILKVATVYVLERETAGERRLELTFALDALGADAPALMHYELPLPSRQRVAKQLDVLCPSTLVEPTLEDTNPLRGLLTVALNSILYATSPGTEPELRSPGEPRARRDGSSSKITFTSDDVWFLPGKIEISTLRGYQALERLPDGRAILHRSMVRGHWRRPAKNWTDQSLRWIAPYWKGPDLAAVIERAYKLTR